MTPTCIDTRGDPEIRETILMQMTLFLYTIKKKLCRFEIWS